MRAIVSLGLSGCIGQWRSQFIRGSGQGAVFTVFLKYSSIYGMEAIIAPTRNLVEGPNIALMKEHLLGLISGIVAGVVRPAELMRAQDETVAAIVGENGPLPVESVAVLPRPIEP